ncbi:MAG TPA: GFA family protein [bacterium]|nr:GFA family protein [bacterium]
MAEAKTYTGSCHCGKVRYEVTMELGQVTECNCSHCSRKGFLLQFVPAEQFKLLQGEQALTEYRFNRRVIQHLFCSTCGVQSFARGNRPDSTAVVAVNVRCLEGVDATALPRKQVDGKRL